MAHTLQKMANSLKGSARFEKQRDLLIVSLQEGRTRLFHGKKKYGDAGSS